MKQKTYTELPMPGRAKLEKLTPEKIIAMVAGDELADPEAPGLRVRCGSLDSDGKAKRVFFYRYRDRAGALRQIRLGEFGPLTLAMARKARARKRLELDQGIDPQEQKQRERTEARRRREVTKAEQARQRNTVGYLVECYLTEVVEPSRKTKGAAETRRLLERTIAAARDAAADEISRERAHEIVKAVARTAPRVAQMARQELRACWEHALAVGRLKESNPFLGKTIGAIPRIAPKQSALKPAQVGALLRWMREPGSYSRTVADALELALRTGLRTGEVCGIHAEEVEERDGVLWLDIPGARMKQGRAHSVPLVGRAREIVLARLQDGGGFLFPSRVGNRAIEQKVLGVEVYACSSRSKAPAYAHRKPCPVGGWAPHDLRRTARTLLAELGCPFEIAESILAHRLPGLAGVYNKAGFESERVEWLTRLNEYLDRLVAANNLVALTARKRA